MVGCLGCCSSGAVAETRSQTDGIRYAVFLGKRGQRIKMRHAVQLKFAGLELLYVGVDAHHPQWQALRWDVEELRVSLFAQELIGRGGISAKKVAQRAAELGGIRR